LERDPLHKWRLNLNNDTFHILSLSSTISATEAKDVKSIVIQIQAPFMQRVNVSRQKIVYMNARLRMYKYCYNSNLGAIYLKVLLFD